MEVKQQINGVKPGDVHDDAQWMALTFTTKKGELSQGVPLFTAKTKSGRKVKAVLKGEVEITDFKGKKIKKADDYLKFLKKGEANSTKLQFDKKAYIELLEDKKSKNKREKPINVVFSMADGIKILKEED